jgi:hypothetical protein
MTRASDGQPDDYDAVKQVVVIVQPFTDPDRERIIRWTREKLGMTPAPSSGPPTPPSPSGRRAAPRDGDDHGIEPVGAPADDCLPVRLADDLQPTAALVKARQEVLSSSLMNAMYSCNGRPFG